MNPSPKAKRAYLMIAGTLLPAMTGAIVVASVKKEIKVTGWDLLLFAGLSCVGGFITAKFLKGNA